MDKFESNDNRERNEKNERQYYSNGEFSAREEYAGVGDCTESLGTESSQTETPAGGHADTRPQYTGSSYAGKKQIPTWVKALLIIAAVIAGIAILATGCNKAVDGVVGSLTGSIFSSSDNSVTTDFGHDYIGVVDINGTISEDSNSTYNHRYILNAIDAMIADDKNKGMILYLDTPGGSVFASDELYFKIKEYQEKTKRPVYSSMQSMAASGGYYISAPCDKIYANRNCWTGSIGVTLGTMYDVSELLDALGIKTKTITSGANKAMGSSVEEMTEEQEEIFQSLVDEAYEQFVGIVAEGRDMKVSEVKKLADGRIYTAKQALSKGLIDEIGTFEEAAEDMKAQYKLSSCALEYFKSPTSTSLTSLLGSAADAISGSESLLGAGNLNADTLRGLIDMNGKFAFSYLCPIQK